MNVKVQGNNIIYRDYILKDGTDGSVGLGSVGLKVSTFRPKKITDIKPILEDIRS